MSGNQAYLSRAGAIRKRNPRRANTGVNHVEEEAYDAGRPMEDPGRQEHRDGHVDLQRLTSKHAPAAPATYFNAPSDDQAQTSGPARVNNIPHLPQCSAQGKPMGTALLDANGQWVIIPAQAKSLDQAISAEEQDLFPRYNPVNDASSSGYQHRIRSSHSERTDNAKNIFQDYSNGEPVYGNLFGRDYAGKLYHAHRDSFFSSLDATEQGSLLKYQGLLDRKQKKNWMDYIDIDGAVVDEEWDELPISQKAKTAATHTVRQTKDQLRRVQRLDGHLYVLERRNVLELLSQAEQEMLVKWWHNKFGCAPTIQKLVRSRQRRKSRPSWWKNSGIRKALPKWLQRHKTTSNNTRQWSDPTQDLKNHQALWASEARHLRKRGREGRGEPEKLINVDPIEGQRY